MGFVRKTTGIDLTGGGAVDAAAEASRIQTAAGREGIDVIRGDLAPFRETGTEAVNMLLQNILDPQGQDPNEIINNPFFQALSQEQDRNTLAQRASLGLAGSGGTQDALKRNILQLGNTFQQQNLANQQARFAQLFNVAGMGQNAAAMTGTQTSNILQNIANSQSTVPLAQSQVASQQGQQLMQFLGGSGQFAEAAGGLTSAFGGGSAASAGGAGLSSLMASFSDRRLKRGISKVSSDENGNIYHFKYIDSDVVYEGRMADELQKVRPDAVSLHESGFLQVTSEFAPRAI